jgi:hypothetical protein
MKRVFRKKIDFQYVEFGWYRNSLPFHTGAGVWDFFKLIKGNRFLCISYFFLQTLDDFRQFGNKFIDVLFKFIQLLNGTLPLYATFSSFYKMPLR